MKLNIENLQRHKDFFEIAGYALPAYDIERMRQNTLQAPQWIHFGAGNLFKAFPAHAAQKLLNTGEIDTGIITVEGYDYELIEKTATPYDNLCILAILHSDQTIKKTILASIAESLVLDPLWETDYNRLLQIFAAPSLRLATFTITEKGYSLPSDYLKKVTVLLYHRFRNGCLPIAMVSMDNCSHNGDLLKNSICTIAEEWYKEQRVPGEFLDYLSDPSCVSFPWTMIDKITPRPDPQVETMLKKDGLENLSPQFTAKKSYTAPFVNAEETEYLVIEDHFPNGRPPLEKAGIYFAARGTVDQAEKMKVCTCLNPLHTALAIFGCLLGYETIAEEMQDSTLLALVKKLGYQEGLPVVVHPGILDPKEFLDTVINRRLPNPFLPDSPKRIATDTSLKLSVRFGETIKKYQSSPDLSVKDLQAIPLVFAGWLRYLMELDDAGNPLVISPDPGASHASAYVKSFPLTPSEKDLNSLDPLLANAEIFGVDLTKSGLADKVKAYFAELSSGPGAVEKTLQKYLL